MLRTYFGEKEVQDCGNCDVCINKKKNAANIASVDDIIAGIQYMVSLKPRSIYEFIDTLSFNREEIINIVTRMVDDGHLKFSPEDQLYSKP